MAEFTNNPPGAGVPPAQKNSFRKGLGFVPNSIETSANDPISDLLKTAPSIAKGQFSISDQTTALYETGATIPLFNLETIAEAQGEEKKQLIHSFGSALVQVGFVGIKAENLQRLVGTVYGEMRRYFHQPLELKLLNWQKMEHQRGFSYRGCECGPKAPRPDFKESFFIPSDFNEWPADSRSFSRVIGEYQSVLGEVYKYLMGFLMEFLDETDDGLNGYANHVLRLAYYPAFKPGDDPIGTWAAAHRDKNALTILSKGTVPGLQFYSNNGFWEPVVVPDAHLIVTTGLLLQQKTAGLIKARWHRVLNPGGKYTRLERLSTVFYGTWPDSYSLKPYASCVAQVTRGMTQSRAMTYLEKFPDVTVGDRFAPRTPEHV